jgi:hypothetical protein
LIKIKSTEPFPEREQRDFDDQWEFIAWLRGLTAYAKLQPVVQKSLQTLVDELCRGAEAEEWEIRPGWPTEDESNVVFVFKCVDMSVWIKFDYDGDCDFTANVVRPNTVAEILNEHRLMFLGG